MNSIFFHKKQIDGYITLLAVLVVGAVGMAIATSLLLLGIGASRTSFAHEQSQQARALANACAEEGLEQIRLATAYTGTGNLTLGQGICSYTVTTTGGTTRTVIASGTVGTLVRKVSIVVTVLNPTITLSSWTEVAN